MLLITRVTLTNRITIVQSIVIMRRRLLHGEKDVRAKLSQRDYKLTLQNVWWAVRYPIGAINQSTWHRKDNKAVYFEDNIPGYSTAVWLRYPIRISLYKMFANFFGKFETIISCCDFFVCWLYHFFQTFTAIIKTIVFT